MTTISRGPFDQAVAFGHHWCGEVHILLDLVERQPLLGLTPEAVADAVVAYVDRYGPEVAEEYDDCLSAPSYHVIRGRATGFALGLGGVEPEPSHLWTALSWDPHGVASGLLAALGRRREELLECLGELGSLVPWEPGPNHVRRAAEAQGVRQGYGFTSGEHLLLALLADTPDDQAGSILRGVAMTHRALDQRLADMLGRSNPPIPPPADPAVAPPSPRATEVFAAAEGLAASLSDGRVRSTDGLISYLWQEDGQQAYPIEAQGSWAGEVVDRLVANGVRVPATPLPEPDRRPWGNRITVPPERVRQIVDTVRAKYPMNPLHPNCLGGEDWVIAHAHIDLRAIVDEILGD